MRSHDPLYKHMQLRLHNKLGSFLSSLRIMGRNFKITYNTSFNSLVCNKNYMLLVLMFVFCAIKNDVNLDLFFLH